MSHKAGDAEKLMSVDLITVATTSGSAWQITKGLTISAPTLAAPRYFQLPDPSTVPLGMKFEVKDGTGNSATNNITISTSGSVMIDGTGSADVINRNWGGKTFISTGEHYVIVGGQVRETIAPVGAGGSVQFDFGGSAGDSLPGGWSQTQTGGWLNNNGVWAVSGDTWAGAGNNTTSLIGEGDVGQGGSYSYNIWSGTAPTSILTYQAGTLEAGKTVSWSWIKDFAARNYHGLFFKVNGVLEKTCPDTEGWLSDTFTIPTTGIYTFSIEWIPNGANSSKQQRPGYHNSCFIDLFTIS